MVFIFGCRITPTYKHLEHYLCLNGCKTYYTYCTICTGICIELFNFFVLLLKLTVLIPFGWGFIVENAKQFLVMTLLGGEEKKNNKTNYAKTISKCSQRLLCSQCVFVFMYKWNLCNSAKSFMNQIENSFGKNK